MTLSFLLDDWEPFLDDLTATVTVLTWLQSFSVSELSKDLGEVCLSFRERLISFFSALKRGGDSTILECSLLSVIEEASSGRKNSVTHTYIQSHMYTTI